MTLKELQERRQKLAAEIRAMGDKHKAQGDAWKDDAERSAWEQLNRDYDENLTAITRAQDAASVQQRMGVLEEHDRRSVNAGTTTPGREDSRREDRQRPDTVDENTRALALAGFFRSELDSRPSRNVRAAMEQCGMHVMQRGLTLMLPPTAVVREWQRSFQLHSADHARGKVAGNEQRALGTATGAKGGVLIPGTFIRAIEANMLFYGGVRQVADQIVTATGDEMGWPTADDTSNEGRQLGESEAPDNDNDPTFALAKWRAYKFTSDEILADFEILEDSAIDLPPLIGALLGERLGRITNRKATLGSGVGTMHGFMTSAVAGKTATGGTFGFDDVIDLEHSIDPAYRVAGAFMCHDAIIAHMRKLKDDNGRPLWEAGYTAEALDTLHGRRLVLNQVMDDTVAAGKKPLAFGDFSKIKMRRVNQIRVYRLVERHRENDQDAFLAFVREDSKVLNAGTHPIKYLAVAA